MAEHLKTLTYTRTAIALHWAIAVLICVQLATGWWMVRAIDVPGQFDTAFTVYQVHKSVGIVVLLLSLVRLAWRVMHRPPEVPVAVSRWQRRLSFVVHAVLYVLMVAVPLAGWLVASASPIGLPTLVFGLFQWPYLPVGASIEPAAKVVHRVLAYGLAVLACGHVLAALKHQVVDRDTVMQRMWPMRTNG